MSEVVSQSQTTSLPDRAAPEDIGLMLRAHAELLCLSDEVIPVLRQVEAQSDLSTEQLGAALAHLEVTWLKARRHAAETDAARIALDGAPDGGSNAPDRAAPDVPALGGGLSYSAFRYCVAVRRLRETVAARIAPLLPSQEPDTPASPVIRRLGDDGQAVERAASGGPSHHARGSL